MAPALLASLAVLWVRARLRVFAAADRRAADAVHVPGLDVLRAVLLVEPRIIEQS